MGVLNGVHSARQAKGLVAVDAKCAAAVSGPEYFGFAAPTIAELIEELPAANLCTEYQPRAQRVHKPRPSDGSENKLLSQALIDLEMLEQKRKEKELEKLVAAKRRAEEQEIRRRMREAERTELGLQRLEQLEMRRREREMERAAKGQSKLRERQSKELDKALEHRERSQRRLVDQLQRRRKKVADVMVRRKIRLDDSHTLQMRRLSAACWEEPLQLPWFFSQQLATMDRVESTAAARLTAEHAQFEAQGQAAAAKVKAAKSKGAAAKNKALVTNGAAAAIEGGTSGSIGAASEEGKLAPASSTAVTLALPLAPTLMPLALEHPRQAMGDVLQLWNFLQIFFAPSRTPVPPLQVFSDHLRMPHASAALDHIHLRLMEVLMQELPNDLDLEKNERDRERREDNSTERKTEFFRVGAWKPFGPKRPLSALTWQEMTRQYMLARVLEFGGTSPQRIMTSMSVINPVSEDQGKAVGVGVACTKQADGVGGEGEGEDKIEVGPGKGRWRSWGTMSVMLYAKGGYASDSIVKAVGDLEGAKKTSAEGGGTGEGGTVDTEVPEAAPAKPGHSTVACHVEFEKIGNAQDSADGMAAEGEAGTGEAVQTEAAVGAAVPLSAVAMDVEDGDEDAMSSKREPLSVREDKMRRALRRLADREAASVGAPLVPVAPSLLKAPAPSAASASMGGAAAMKLDASGASSVGFVPTDKSWVGWLRSLAKVPAALGSVVEHRIQQAIQAGDMPGIVSSDLQMALAVLASRLEETGADDEGAYAHAQNIGLQAVYDYVDEYGDDATQDLLVLRARLLPPVERDGDQNKGQDARHASEPTIMVEDLTARFQACVETLKAQPLCKPFLLPINLSVLGKVGKQYKKMIKRPMDLGTIQTSLDDSLYTKDASAAPATDKNSAQDTARESSSSNVSGGGSGSLVSSAGGSGSAAAENNIPPTESLGMHAFKAAFAFAADCRLVFSNCMLFNDHGSPLWQVSGLLLDS
jgi:hypothetical protein